MVITDAGRSKRSRGMEAVSFMQMMLVAKERPVESADLPLQNGQKEL